MDNFFVDDVEYKTSEKIPEEIFDIVNQSMENTINFLSDPDNIIFSIENNFIGMSLYFYPFNSRNVVYDCEDKNLGQFVNSFSDNDIPYINMESLGIIRERPNENTGVLVRMTDFENLILHGVRIFKLQLESPNFIVRSLVSKAVLDDGQGNYSFVGALHCQKNYVGFIFSIEDLVSSKNSTVTLTCNGMTEIIEISRFSKFKNLYPNTDLHEKDFNVIRKLNQNYFFYLDAEERNYITQVLGYINPLDYPKQYFEICQEEKKPKNYENFNFLIDVTDDDQLFIPKINESKNILSRKSFIENNYISFSDMDAIGNFLKFLSSNQDSKFIDFPFLVDCSNYLVIAGGSALSFLSHKFLDDPIPFQDIDFFFHSCSEEHARGIIKDIILYFETNTDSYLMYNSENAFSCVIHYLDHSRFKMNFKVQFIKRLYTSPSEIIHGFDVDCCCVLMTLNNKFYTTQRGYYSIQHRCNFINFDRLSPSYETRCIKYLHRKFNIFIPQIEHFLLNLDCNFYDYPEKLYGSYIILKYMFDNKFNKYFSGYDKTSHRILKIEDHDLVFKTLEPSSQVSNTFNKIIFEDTIQWYPQPQKIVYTPPRLINEIFEITKENNPPLLGKDIICVKPKKEYSFYDDITSVFKILDMFKNSLVIVGDIPLGIFLGQQIISPICICFIKNDLSIKDVIKAFKKCFIKAKNLGRHEYSYSKYDRKTYFEIDYYVSSDSYESDELYKLRIPSLHIAKKIFSSYQEILDTQLYDFQRIIMVSDSLFLTDSTGQYCINNKINLNGAAVLDYYLREGFRSLFPYRMNDLQSMFNFWNDYNEDVEIKNNKYRFFGINSHCQLISKSNFRNLKSFHDYLNNQF